MGKEEGGGKEEEEINFIHFIKQPSFQSIEESMWRRLLLLNTMKLIVTSPRNSSHRFRIGEERQNVK